MHGLRHQFLAGAALTRDEHRDASSSHARNLLVDALHGRAVAPKLPEMPAMRQFRFQRIDFSLQCRRLHDARQDALQLFEVDRLDQIVGSAKPQRLDG